MLNDIQSPQSLQELWSSPAFFLAQQGYDRLQQSQTNNSINQQAALEDLFNAQATNPLKQRELDLRNQTLAAQLPGVQADSEIRGYTRDSAKRKRDVEAGVPIEEQIKLEQQRLANSVSKEQLAAEFTSVRKMLANPFIKPHERQILEQVLSYEDSLYKLQQTNTSKETIAETQAAARARAAAEGRNRAGSTPKPPAPPKSLAELETRYRAQAYATEDPEERAALLQQADMLAEQQRQRIQDKADASKAGSVDLSAAGVAVRPGITTTPNAATASRPARQAESKTPPMYAKNPSTGERIMSTDGGKTWNKVK